ncbi:hypothetical protein ABEF95_000512 [Exophiala dermatitidis]
MDQVKAPTTILDLEIEVLATILEHVCDTSPRTGPALARVNKQFNNAVQLVRHRHTTLYWEHEAGCFVTPETIYWDLEAERFVTPARLPPTSWKTDDFLRGVRHLTIRQCDIHNRSVVFPFMGQLSELICQIGNLQTLTWDCISPPLASLVQTLEERHPRAHFHVRRVDLSACDWLDELPEAGKSPLVSKCLRSFGAEISSAYWTVEKHILFQKIITSAPNLKFASLMSSSTNKDMMDGWESWHVKQKPTSSLRHLTLDGWPLSADALDYWSKFVDLAALESLKCSRGPITKSYFDRAPQVLTNLKHVSLNLVSYARRDTVEGVQNYLETCAPLSTLSLWSWHGKVSLESILSRHGPTLEALHLHERGRVELITPYHERYYVPALHSMPTLRPILSTCQLRQIFESCPKLKVFTFDLERDTQFLNINGYHGYLEELKSVKLDKLQIYMDCGVEYVSHASVEWDDETVLNRCGGDFPSVSGLPLFQDEPDFPTIHPPSSSDNICRFVGELWKHIFGARTHGERLLDVKFGEWERLPCWEDEFVRQKDLRVRDEEPSHAFTALTNGTDSTLALKYLDPQIPTLGSAVCDVKCHDRDMHVPGSAFLTLPT